VSAGRRSTWAARSNGARTLATAAAALLAIAGYIAFVYAIDASRTRMRSSVAALRADAVKLERNAAELERLRGQGMPQTQQGDLRALIEASARSAGFSQAQMRIDAKAAQEVAVVLGSVSFGAWLAWVADLEKQQVRLETCRIEPMSAAGLVSVTVTFVRSPP
jgi:type II secretory pathway component PulM